MYDTLYQIVSVDVYTLSVVCVLSGWAALILRHVTESTLLALIFMPVIIIGALVGIYACRQLDLVFVFDKDTNVILTACVGMIAALIVMLIMTRIMYIANAAHCRAQLTNKGLDGRISEVRTIGR